MLKQQISKIQLKSTLEVNKYLQFENKCQKLLRNDEIRFVGIINNMGNLISGGFNDGIDLLETDDQRRSLYMQMALEIAMRKDFDNTLGKINYVITNRDNVLMISIPIDYSHIMLISAESTSIAEEIISKIRPLEFFQSDT